MENKKSKDFLVVYQTDEKVKVYAALRKLDTAIKTAKSYYYELKQRRKKKNGPDSENIVVLHLISFKDGSTKRFRFIQVWDSNNEEGYGL